jgi:hypothetical protein
LIAASTTIHYPNLRVGSALVPLPLSLICYVYCCQVHKKIVGSREFEYNSTREKLEAENLNTTAPVILSTWCIDDADDDNEAETQQQKPTLNLRPLHLVKGAFSLSLLLIPFLLTCSLSQLTKKKCHWADAAKEISLGHT